MKRTFAIALVAAVSLGTTGAYVAHANEGDVRFPQDVRSNMSISFRDYNKEMAGYVRDLSKAWRSHKVAFNQGAVSGAIAIETGAFDTHRLYVCPSAQSEYEAKQGVGASVQSAMWELWNTTNQSYRGATASAINSDLGKWAAKLERKRVSSDKRVFRLNSSNCSFYNKKDDTGATFTWGGTTTCGIPTPGVAPFSYFQQYGDPKLTACWTIPSSSPGQATCYVSGYLAPFNSYSVDCSGPTGGGSTSGSADSWGCIWTSFPVSGSGNMQCSLRSQGVRCSSLQTAACTEGGQLTNGDR
jgi:hypothetical protein